MAHKTKINGTTYTIKGGRTKISGTTYKKISAGRTKINGTYKSIKFTSDTPVDPDPPVVQTVPVTISNDFSGTSISTTPSYSKSVNVGNSVTIYSDTLDLKVYYNGSSVRTLGSAYTSYSFTVTSSMKSISVKIYMASGNTRRADITVT